MAAALLVTVGGGAITSYISLKGDINDIKVSFTAQIAAHEVRIAEVERETEELRSDNKDFYAETRKTLAQISQAIADLRVDMKDGKLERR